MKNGKITNIISKYDVILNIGFNHGVRIGETYLIYSDFEVEDPDTKAIIEVIRIPKAKVKIYKINENTSFARSTEISKKLTGFGVFNKIIDDLSEKPLENKKNPIAESLLYSTELKQLNVNESDITPIDTNQVKIGDKVIEVTSKKNKHTNHETDDSNLISNSNSKILINDKNGERIISFDNIASLSINDNIILSFFVNYVTNGIQASDFSIQYSKEEWIEICNQAVSSKDLNNDELFKIVLIYSYYEKWKSLISKSFTEEQFVAIQEIIKTYISTEI